jgi:glycine dehydrogenase
MNGMKVVVVKCDTGGNIDMADLTAKAEAHSANLAAFMVTYPSTHGVFEAHIKDVCRVSTDTEAVSFGRSQPKRPVDY